MRITHWHACVVWGWAASCFRSWCPGVSLALGVLKATHPLSFVFFLLGRSGSKAEVRSMCRENEFPILKVLWWSRSYWLEILSYLRGILFVVSKTHTHTRTQDRRNAVKKKIWKFCCQSHILEKGGMPSFEQDKCQKLNHFAVNERRRNTCIM